MAYSTICSFLGSLSTHASFIISHKETRADLPDKLDSRHFKHTKHTTKHCIIANYIQMTSKDLLKKLARLMIFVNFF